MCCSRMLYRSVLDLCSRTALTDTRVSLCTLSQHRQYLVRKGCILCSVDGFENYSEYVSHIDSAAHKQVRCCGCYRIEHRLYPVSSHKCRYVVCGLSHSYDKSYCEQSLAGVCASLESGGVAAITAGEC